MVFISLIGRDTLCSDTMNEIIQTLMMSDPIATINQASCAVQTVSKIIITTEIHIYHSILGLNLCALQS